MCKFSKEALAPCVFNTCWWRSNPPSTCSNRTSADFRACWASNSLHAEQPSAVPTASFLSKISDGVWCGFSVSEFCSCRSGMPINDLFAESQKKIMGKMRGCCAWGKGKSVGANSRSSWTNAPLLQKTSNLVLWWVQYWYSTSSCL